MIYFKYKTSFKRAGALTDLIEKQNITEVYDQDKLLKHIAKGDDVYCFLNPYASEINETNQLDWALSEEEAMNRFYDSREQI
jgi:hypothetical protein